MASNDTSNYREDVWNEVKDTFVGFERANDHIDPMNHILINTRDNQPFNLYIHGINVEGELYHRQIKRDNSALDKVVEAGKTYCRTAKYAAEFKHLFEYGPYGVAVELALSTHETLTRDNQGNYTADDLIWVKFFQDQYNPDKFVLSLGNDEYRINQTRNAMNFVGLRVYPDGRTVMLRRNPVYRSPAYCTIEPSDTFDTNLGDEVNIAAMFYRDELTEDYRRCKYDGFGLLAGRAVGNEEDRNISPSDYHRKIPANIVGSKYHGRNSDWAGNVARRIITGYPLNAFSIGMRLYPVENTDGSIDYYPFKIMPGVPEIYLNQDIILNRDLKELISRYYPYPSEIQYGKDAVDLTEINAINLDRVKIFENSSIIEPFRELAWALTRIKGDNAPTRREVVARRNFERAGWRAEDGQPLWDLIKKWFTSDDADIIQMKFSHLIGPDLNNITHEGYAHLMKPGTIPAARLREWYLNVLIDMTKHSGYPSIRDFFVNLSNGIENIYHKETTGTIVASPTYESTPEILYDVDSGTFINRITPVNRPTKPVNDAPRVEREQYNTLADNYNAYVDKLNVRYGNFDHMKINESDKFDLSLPYQVKMPPEQFGNPQYDKPIEGTNPGDLIGFIAEMVYGIQNNDSVNVLNAIPGIYIPAVIPEQFRYLGRRDDVIKNQFTRTLNKWIELKPKRALVRDELDAIDDLVNELIMLSGNPTTPSGLEDGSVYSLSTLFKGSLYKERPARLDGTPPTPPVIEADTSEHHHQPPAEVNPYTPEAEKDYRVSFDKIEPTTGNAIFNVTDSSGAQVTGTVRAYYNDKRYEVGDSANPGRLIVPNSDLPEHEAIWHFTIGHRGANSPYEVKITTPGVSVPARMVESETPHLVQPKYEYRIRSHEAAWILSTEPLAILAVERVDGGDLPDNIEVRYQGHKYEISNGQIYIPNNDLPVHDTVVSMKVSYKDDPDNVGSIVNNVTLPAHHPHEFRIEKDDSPSNDELNDDIRYRITLASGNQIEEESLTVQHGNDTFDVSTVTTEGGEFIIHNEQLPRGGDTWDFDVHYSHRGETVTSTVRGVDVDSRIDYFVEYTGLDKQGAHYHVYRNARYNSTRENQQRLASGKLHRGDKVYPISDGSATIPNSDLPSWDIRGGSIKDTFIVEYTTPYGTYEDTVKDVIVPGEYYDVDRIRAEHELEDAARRHHEESAAGGITPPESAHVDA